MAPLPPGHDLQNHGAISGADILRRLDRRVVDSFHVVAVFHRHARDAEARRPGAEALEAGHLPEILGDGEEVVLDDEEHGELEGCRHVHTLVKGTFAGASVSGVGHRDVALPLVLEVVGEAHRDGVARAQGAAQDVQVFGHVHEVGLAGLALAGAGGFQQRLGQHGLHVAAPHEQVGVGAVVGADRVGGAEGHHGGRSAGLLAHAQMGHAQGFAVHVGIPEPLVKPAGLVHVFVEREQDRKICHNVFSFCQLLSLSCYPFYGTFSNRQNSYEVIPWNYRPVGRAEITPGNSRLKRIGIVQFRRHHVKSQVNMKKKEVTRHGKNQIRRL